MGIEVVTPGVSLISTGGDPTHVIAYSGGRRGPARAVRTFKINSGEAVRDIIEIAQTWRDIAKTKNAEQADAAIQTMLSEHVVTRAKEEVKKSASMQAAKDDAQRVLAKYPPIREHFTYTNVYGWDAPPVNSH